eukprot:6174083-Pleurochrysis_carterae.AAC.4
MRGYCRACASSHGTKISPDALHARSMSARSTVTARASRQAYSILSRSRQNKKCGNKYAIPKNVQRQTEVTNKGNEAGLGDFDVESASDEPEQGVAARASRGQPAARESPRRRTRR